MRRLPPDVFGQFTGGGGAAPGTQPPDRRQTHTPGSRSRRSSRPLAKQARCTYRESGTSVASLVRSTLKAADWLDKSPALAAYIGTSGGKYVWPPVCHHGT